jgi:hypothetical protein
MTATTVTYRTRRREIAQFFRFLWMRSPRLRNGQIVTAGGVLAVSLVVQAASGRGGSRALLIGLAWAAAAVGFLWLYPVLRFKSQERRLAIDERGIHTSIGAKTALIPWREIDLVAPRGDRIYIVRKKLNGFVVPLRACASREDLEAFAKEASRLKEGAAVETR